MRIKVLGKVLVFSIILICLTLTIAAPVYGCNGPPAAPPAGPPAVAPATGTGVSTELIQVKSTVFNTPVPSTTEHVEVGRTVEIGENFIIFLVM